MTRSVGTGGLQSETADAGLIRFRAPPFDILFSEVTETIERTPQP